MLSRIKAITKKEFKQLGRDKRMLFVIFFFPVFLLWMFGYAINFDVKNIQLAVYDREWSDLSRNFVNSITSLEYFQVVKYVKDDEELKVILDQKEAQAILILPKDFSSELANPNKELKIQFLIDGVDGNTASIIKNYVNAATLTYNQKYNHSLMMQKSSLLSHRIL